MSQSPGDGPARRKDDVEPKRDEASPGPRPDQAEVEPSAPPAPGQAAGDADSAASGDDAEAAVERTAKPEAQAAGEPEAQAADPGAADQPEPQSSVREPEPEPQPAETVHPEPAAESTDQPEREPVKLFEPTPRPGAVPPPLPAEQPPLPAEQPPPAEPTQVVDLTSVEPPEPVAPPEELAPPEKDDSTVVVLTDRTVRDSDEPEEDSSRRQPSPENVPAYAPPSYVPPAYPAPPSPPYTPGHGLPSASRAVPPDDDSELDTPGDGGPGTGSVPLLEEIPGGWQAVRRRHRRQTATFLVALLGVLGLGTVAGLMYTGRMAWPFGGRVDVSAQVCTPSKPLPPKQIHVRVYNGSNRAGLAKTVAAQLKALGFVVQETGNDPLEAKLTTPVEIRYGDTGELAGKTTTAYFPGKNRQRTDDRTNDVVDVVLGPKFTRVNTKREANRALTGAHSTLPLTCPPGVTPPPTPTPTAKPKPSATPGKKAKPTPTPTH